MVTSKVERVTPEIASQWLKGNTLNRPLRLGYVVKLAEQMKAGAWRVAQPISFNGDGTLLDGQHRLSAIVRSGTTVEMLVVRGLAHDVFDVLDQGVARSAADLFSLRGGKNVAKACAIAASIILRAVGTNSRGVRGEVAATAEENDSDIQRVISLTPLKYMQGSERAAFVIAAQKYGWAAVEPMLLRLSTQTFTGPDDPMNTLNRWMVNHHMRMHGRRASVKREVAYSAAVVCIRACLEGRKLTFIRVADGTDFE